MVLVCGSIGLIQTCRRDNFTEDISYVIQVYVKLASVAVVIFLIENVAFGLLNLWRVLIHELHSFFEQVKRNY